jgi:ribose 5-phosphate isomerase A
MLSRMRQEEQLTDDGAAALAAAAMRYVEPGHVVGLGTGRAASVFIETLAARVRAGLDIRGVPTSKATAALAQQRGIPLVSLEDVADIDVAIDGADEVDPRMDLMKGYGGALLREKVVASASRRFIVLVGREKLVPALGSHGRLPVEIVAFAAGPCRRRLVALGYPPRLRANGSEPVVTDNGNLIFDCQVRHIADPASLDAKIRTIPGVVGTGLFLGMTTAVLLWDGAHCRTLTPPPPDAAAEGHEPPASR